MAATIELCESSEIRRYLSEGLWLQRMTPPRASTVAPALRWTLELAAAGEPVPPIGFIADVGQLVLETRGRTRSARDWPTVPGWPPGLTRTYEDLVLGKLDSDGTVARGADALARYRGRDRDRGLAFLLDRLRHRAGFGGVLLNPAAIKSALDVPPDEFLAAGWESLAQEGPRPVLVTLYEELTVAIRDAADALGPEDVFELEHGTALAAFGQRVALRQVLLSAAEFEASTSRERPRIKDRSRDVATHLLDEDVYPVGGFASISTRGSLESLLNSQLVFMERGERPDLFDIKYVRDELLYYSRDESQFLRRRRTFLIVLAPSLVHARIKDESLPHQRIILLLALLVAAVRRLADWLTDEALTFEFLFLKNAHGDPLAQEQALLEMVFREFIARGTVIIETVTEDQLSPRARSRSRRSLCRGLAVDTADRELLGADVPTAHLRLVGPAAVLITDDSDDPQATDDPPEAWRKALECLLSHWLGAS